MFCQLRDITDGTTNSELYKQTSSRPSVKPNRKWILQQENDTNTLVILKCRADKRSDEPLLVPQGRIFKLLKTPLEEMVTEDLKF